MLKSENVKIMVVTHKNTTIPKNNIYVPILVGDNKKNIHIPNALKDDCGNNIASKNSNYCELTALYWAWKNLDADVIGLVHYRRLLMSTTDRNKVLEKNEIQNLLKNHDAILPKKRNYFIETTYSHFAHNHNINDLLETKKIIKDYYPNYIEVFDEVMTQKKSHRFNMLVMKHQKFNEYCEWLFSILFELENRIDISDYDVYQSRVFGFISERLLDVWIAKNSVNYIETPFKFTEKQNWIKKGSHFLIKKLRGVK